MKCDMICNGGLFWHYSRWNRQRHEVVKQLGICLHLSGSSISIYLYVCVSHSIWSLHCQTGLSCIMKFWSGWFIYLFYLFFPLPKSTPAPARMIQQPCSSVFVPKINNGFMWHQIRTSRLNLHVIGWFYYAISAAHLLFYNLSCFI